MDKWEPKKTVVARRKPAVEGSGTRGELLAARWPVLGEALVRHQRNVAATFAEEAYFCVEDGLIRQEERVRLAERAQELGLRVFDAELLMACALRDWAADNMHKPRVGRVVKKSGAWKKWVWAAVGAVVLDVVVVVLLFG